MTETLAGDASLACKTNNKEGRVGRVAIKHVSVKAVITRSAQSGICSPFNFRRIQSSSTCEDSVLLILPPSPTTFLLLS